MFCFWHETRFAAHGHTILWPSVLNSSAAWFLCVQSLLAHLVSSDLLRMDLRLAGQRLHHCYCCVQWCWGDWLPPACCFQPKCSLRCPACHSDTATEGNIGLYSSIMLDKYREFVIYHNLYLPLTACLITQCKLQQSGDGWISANLRFPGAIELSLSTIQ